MTDGAVNNALDVMRSPRSSNNQVLIASDASRIGPHFWHCKGRRADGTYAAVEESQPNFYCQQEANHIGEIMLRIESVDVLQSGRGEI